MTAGGVALMMHLLLLAGTGSSSDPENAVGLMPPQTHYAMLTGEADVDARAVRMLKSPVLSSLPSELGFSGELRIHDVQNSKTFTPLSVHSEHFLELAPTGRSAGSGLDSKQLMISEVVRGPALPVDTSIRHKPYPAAKRVLLAPELRDRLKGGIVLPAALNQPVEQPWTVHAALSISEQGVVEHVFLDQPLGASALNRQVLQVLYKLHFKPGTRTESSIEIYAPESAGQQGEAE